MTLGLMVLFVALLLLLRQNVTKGRVFCGYLIGYGVLRGVVESFRGDSAHDLLGMTVSQVISISLILVGIVLAFVFRKVPCLALDSAAGTTKQNLNPVERKLS